MQKHIYPMNEFINAIVAAKKAIKEHLAEDQVIRRFYILPYRFGTYLRIASNSNYRDLALPISDWKVVGIEVHPCDDEKYKDHPDASNLCTGNIVLQVQLAVQGPHLCIVLTIIDVKTDNYTTMSRSYVIDYASPSDQSNLCKEIYWDIQELGVMDEITDALSTSLGNNSSYYVKP